MTEIDNHKIIEIAPTIKEAERRLNQYRNINKKMGWRGEYKIEPRKGLPGYLIMYYEKE